MSTIDAQLAEAEALRRAGRLGEAQARVQQVLQADPTSAEAHHLLGLIFAMAGRFDLAETSFRRAVELRGDFHRAQSDWGAALELLGRLDEAATAFRRAIELAPLDAESHRRLAGTLEQQGARAEALAECRRAVELDPSHAASHNSLGVLLERAGASEKAIAHLRTAVRLKPELVDANVNLGAALDRAGRPQEALAWLERAVALAPEMVGAHANLGLALRSLGRLDEATAALGRAVELDPQNVERLVELGLLHLEQGGAEPAQALLERALSLDPHSVPALVNLGVALERQNRLDEAIDAYRQALAIDPRCVDAEVNGETAAGLKAFNEGRHEAAVACFRRALEQRPERAEIHSSLGVALFHLDRLDEAEHALRRAITLKPDMADAHTNLGAVLELQGHDPADPAVGSLVSFRRAVELKPDSAKIRHNYGMALLRSGNLTEGWPEFEWRLQRKTPGRQFAEPRWSGASAKRETVLLWEDEGLGDSMQCVRFVELLHARCGRVIVECRRQLASLLATCAGVDQVIAAGSLLPTFDAQLPLLSLPGVLGTTLATIPARVPYLFPRAGLVENWQQALGSPTEFKVGIAWQGSREFGLDRLRSIPLARFAPLAEVPGVRLFSLQFGDGSEQLSSAGFPVADLTDRLGDFENTGAIMSSLDLVITSDSVPAHLAGALGLPVWVALAYVADWRWLLERNDSPWYPTMRLYRQTRPGDWEEVFERIKHDLVALRTSKDRARVDD